jgi:hypothetical protein
LVDAGCDLLKAMVRHVDHLHVLRAGAESLDLPVDLLGGHE